MLKKMFDFALRMICKYGPTKNVRQLYICRASPANDEVAFGFLHERELVPVEKCVKVAVEKGERDVVMKGQPCKCLGSL